jgi:glycosyltransferase involved in cell wall biosynthesis
MLRQQYKNVDNLHFLGFQAGQIKEETLSKAWILINTSMYEALPVSFLEALAHRCAILSTRNPDGYTARFGVESDIFCLRQNLEWLIEDDRWKELGNRGHEYVSKVHSTENGVQMHLDLYKRLLR